MSEQAVPPVNDSVGKDLRPVAYVSMSPNPDLEPVYFKVIRPVLEDHGLECTRTEGHVDAGIVVQQTMEAIDEAELVLCDLTYKSGRTYYELGIAHAFRKQAIVISQETADIPFDTRYVRALAYKDNRFGLLELRDDLCTILCSMFPKSGREPVRQPVGMAAVVMMNELENARSALFHTSPDAKRYAMRFLGDIRDTASWERIRRIVSISSESPEVVRDGLTALHKIDPERALDELFGRHGIWHASHVVRERVVTLVGNYAKTQDLIDRLKDQIGDDSWGVRVAVCQVLGKWGATEARNLLHERRAVDPEQPVRVAAEAALRSMARTDT